MSNKEYVRGAYDEIHASKELFGKVMDMNKKKTRNIMRYAAGAVATLALAFVASNGICYAATGETWVTKVKVFVNGEETEEDMVWNQDGDYVYGEMELEVDEDDDVKVSYEEAVEDVPVDSEDGNSVVEFDNESYETKLMEENDKVYLVVGDTKIDITEDFKDGEAKGSFVIDKVDYQYKITGNIEEYSMDILCNK